MHNEAFAFVKQFATEDPISVIEIGSRNINGTVRTLFPNAAWIGLDLHPGPDVDVVCDMLEYTPQDVVDLVVCCEVLEHAEQWEKMITHASWWVKPGGLLLITCAGPGRAPHSHIDGCQLRENEYYGNIDPQMLRSSLDTAGFRVLICTQVGADTQAACLLGA
jgi:SAM-dependent methyltransferase